MRLIYIFCFILPELVLSQSDLNKRGIEFIESQIKIVESLHKGKTVGHEIVRAIDILEDLTKVKVCYDYDISQEPSKITTEYILQDWKNWLRINHEKIYWNEATKSIELSDNIQYLNKDPKEEFLKKFELLKSNTFGEFINVNEQMCTYFFFSNLVSLGSNYLEWNEEKQMVLNSKEYFEKLMNWYNKNKEKLIWDIENQIIVNKG